MPKLLLPVAIRMGCRTHGTFIVFPTWSTYSFIVRFLQLFNNRLVALAKDRSRHTMTINSVSHHPA